MLQFLIVILFNVFIILAKSQLCTFSSIIFRCLYNFQTLKNEIKQRETTWSQVYWEMVEPVVMVRTLRARMVSILLLHLTVFYLLF
jgi:hypothetical protein